MKRIERLPTDLKGADWVSDSRDFEPIEWNPLVRHEISWRDGFKDIVAEFPSLSGLPVVGGFTWGRRSLLKHSLSNQDLEMLRSGNAGQVEDKILRAIRDIGVCVEPGNIARISPSLKRESPQPEVFEVTKEKIQEYAQNRQMGDSMHLRTGADFIWTKEKDIALVVMPGDCPSAIIYAETREGDPIVGIGHYGRDEVENRMPVVTILTLRDLGVDPDTIRIGITPGISLENYYIQPEDVDRIFPDGLDRWEEHSMYRKELDKTKRSWILEERMRKILHLDIMGRILADFKECGIPQSAIEAYGIDTYEAARMGEVKSYRYSTSIKQKHMDGRFIVVAKLES